MTEIIKIALVTGASKGIGRGIAYALARQGWDVAVNYCRDEAGARETADGVMRHGRRAWLLQADVANSDHVRSMFNEIKTHCGGLDLLVNNAGVQTFSSLLKLREEDWDRVINTNLKGCFLCMQQPTWMMKDRGGSIINIGSGCNKVPFPNLVDYSASKGGIENLTKVAAVELGRYRIRVNCVAPGAIEIERTKNESTDYAGTWGPLTPLARVGEPSDVANMVAFLASDAAEFTTGQTIFVDGGLFSKPQWPYEIQE
ncbi:MAG: SDR family oxidoreductase [Planctomycetales bacterium]|nr:SDR family oxidoreductase [Planctomycetales bacterium]